jgi:hypothetical protein
MVPFLAPIVSLATATQPCLTIYIVPPVPGWQLCPLPVVDIHRIKLINIPTAEQSWSSVLGRSSCSDPHQFHQSISIYSHRQSQSPLPHPVSLYR